MNRLFWKMMKKHPIHKLGFEDKIDVDFCECTDSCMVLGTSTDKEVLYEIFGKDKVKEVPGDFNIYIIEYNRITDKDILNIIHEIGVKYINGEPLMSKFKKESIRKIKYKLYQSLNYMNHSNFEVQIKDDSLVIIHPFYTRKEDVAKALGLKSDLFFHIVTKSYGILICDCPRVVFEEYFDKQENCESLGANKWLLSNTSGKDI